MKRLAALLTASLAAAACGGAPHVGSFTPKQREYKKGEYAASKIDAKPTGGSLYSEAVPGFLEDTRAVRVGDVVVVRIDEQANASGNATTQLSKTTNRDVNVDAFLGLLPAIKQANPNVDPGKLISLAASAGFNGDGTTSRQGQLTGNIAVRVTQQMPNGDLFIEGTKVVMINREEIHLYISGLIRRADIAQDNSVASSRIADAQVEFTGRGDVADTTDRGWLTKILDFISPF
jgi:flagellar L-ring protein precursor FlgH